MMDRDYNRMEWELANPLTLRDVSRGILLTGLAAVTILAVVSLGGAILLNAALLAL